MWRECIKKVWEVDPLTCPQCTGEMRINSFIYEKMVIKKILKHVDMYEEQKNQRATPAASPEYTEQDEIVPYADD